LEREAGLANMGLVENTEKEDLGFENVAIAADIVVGIFDCIVLAAADLEFERCNEGKPQKVEHFRGKIQDRDLLVHLELVSSQLG